MPKLGNVTRRMPNENLRLVFTTIIGVVMGFFIGVSIPMANMAMLHLPDRIIAYIDHKHSSVATQIWENSRHGKHSDQYANSKIYVPTNPRGAERLPPGIVVHESDFYQRRLWGKPSEDLTIRQKYLVTFTVGYDQMKNIDAAVKKFSEEFAIMLFHYDGRTTEWDKFEWSKRAIHVSVKKQTKWWYAKRFLHPDIVAPYEYIFIWDEDLGVEHFNAEEYIRLVKKHGLEISQPALEPNKGLTWQMTKRRGEYEVHKETEERPGWCTDPRLPPCAAYERVIYFFFISKVDFSYSLARMITLRRFVEIMATVFSRYAWRCVWHMIQAPHIFFIISLLVSFLAIVLISAMLQNDLVHGWGLDFALRKCVEPAHEKIGVVDAQWIVHQVVPSLGNQGQTEKGRAPWEGVRERCKKEWAMFQTRLADAEKASEKSKGSTSLKTTVAV